MTPSSYRVIEGLIMGDVPRGATERRGDGATERRGRMGWMRVQATRGLFDQISITPVTSFA